MPEKVAGIMPGIENEGFDLARMCRNTCNFKLSKPTIKKTKIR